jgi:hypothetical protein
MNKTCLVFSNMFGDVSTLTAIDIFDTPIFLQPVKVKAVSKI